MRLAMKSNHCEPCLWNLPSVSMPERQSLTQRVQHQKPVLNKGAERGIEIALGVTSKRDDFLEVVRAIGERQKVDDRRYRGLVDLTSHRWIEPTLAQLWLTVEDGTR